MITVSDSTLPNTAPDLWISANISGQSYEALRKAGAGTLLLTGNNTYSGPTLLTAGFVDIGSNTAFGNSSLVSLNAVLLRSVSLAGSPTATTPGSALETSTTSVSNTVANPIRWTARSPSSAKGPSPSPARLPKPPAAP